MVAVRHVSPEFYVVSNEILTGSNVDVPIEFGDIGDLAEEALGWRPSVVRLAEQQRPVALADPHLRQIGFSESALVLSHVLHEIAHLKVGAEHGHDEVFIAAFGDLIETYGSAELADRLRNLTGLVDIGPVDPQQHLPVIIEDL
jgi:hypothetical protein